MQEKFDSHIDWFVKNIESRKRMLPTFAHAGGTLTNRVNQDLSKFIEQHGQDKVYNKVGELEEFSVSPEYSGRYKIISSSLNHAAIFTDLLPKMTLVSLVSLFDAYLARLVRTLLQTKPEILNGSNKQLTFSQINEFKSIEEARDHVAELEIQALLRESHTTQFEWLENKIGIPLRKNLSIWKEFIEITERRNILVHADGIVNKQYITICSQNENSKENLPIVGQQLNVSPEYYMRACDVFAEIGVKLAQVMWRKVLPDENENADSALIDVVYNFLFYSEYELAEVIARLAEVPAIKIKSTKNLYYLKINLAIALKGQEKTEQVNLLLNSFDCTALSDIFQLAISVLKEDWEKATEYMIKIGHNGEIDKSQYRIWPLFRWFRKTDKFKDTYKSIFGEEYKILSTDNEDIDRDTETQESNDTQQHEDTSN